jgi:polar amino acid transport system substrate-binding protein
MSHPTSTGTKAGVLLVAATMALTGCGSVRGAGSTTSAAPSAAADPALSDSLFGRLPQRIRDKGELVIATNAPYAPLEFFDKDNKTLIGFDIDLGNAIGKALGVKVTWKNVSFDSIIPGLQAGRYDIGMAGFGVQRDRLNAVDFVSYYMSGGGFLIKRGSGIKIKDQKDAIYGTEFCGLRVAVQSGTDAANDMTKVEKLCREQGKNPVTTLRIADQNVAILTLTSGRSDVVLGDTPQLEWAAHKSNGKLCVAGTFRTAHSLAGIAVPKRSAELNEPLREAVAELLASGEYASIGEKWGVVDGAVSESKIFTEPDQVSDSEDIFPEPAKQDCA